MVANPTIDSVIYMFRHYEALAEKCFDVYNDPIEAYFMYDYYMGMTAMYENILIRILYI